MGRRILRLILSLAGVAIFTWVGFRLLPLNATTQGFAYLLLVLVIASVWGFFEASVASLAATLTYNRYFFEPIGTFTIDDPRHETKTIGNFWVDVTRGSVYVLLPISIVAALFLSSQGVIQNLKPYTEATTVEGAKQTIAQGPIASQEAIKELGTNGGGPFNANSSHPFENPTPVTTCSKCGCCW